MEIILLKNLILTTNSGFSKVIKHFYSAKKKKPLFSNEKFLIQVLRTVHEDS